ncbi:MAG: MATE family efflux transporter [Desulfobacteraceae bacterium]|nr:MATE family efflux transporter [Desulfobacteraceae bacterium]
MSAQSQNILDDYRIGRLLLKLSLPSFAGMFVMMLYNVVDTIFVGHYVGSLGIAGLSIVFPFQILYMGIGQLIGLGGASLISRLIGADNTPRAERGLGNAVAAVIVLSAVLMITAFADIDFWLRLMGASDTILPYARDYMSIIIIGMFFQTLVMSSNGLIRAEGNAKTPMIAMIIGGGLNILLDPIFIVVLGMGIQGVALATVTSQFISTVYILRYYLSGKSFLKIRVKNLLFEWSILKEIFAIGIASFTRTFATSFSVILVNNILVVYGGDLAVSAYGIIHRIIMFTLLPGITIGQGLQPVLGFNYGAKRFDMAMRAIKLALIAATSICFILFAVIQIIPELIVSVFTSDSELIELTAHAARVVFSVLYLLGFIMVGSLIFQAIGKAGKSFLTAVARPVLFLIPLLFILPRFFQLEGIWIAFPIANVLTFILTLSLLIPQLKELKKKDLFIKEQAWKTTQQDYPVC